jgi:hypothetical protein
MRKTSKYYDLIPENHTCIDCGGTKSTVSFIAQHGSLALRCNRCRSKRLKTNKYIPKWYSEAGPDKTCAICNQDRDNIIFIYSKGKVYDNCRQCVNNGHLNSKVPKQKLIKRQQIAKGIKDYFKGLEDAN